MWWKKSSKTSRRDRRRQTPATQRPRLEALEDRCLLSLTPAVNYSVAGGPIDAAFGDFNGDGHSDVATINTSQLSVVHGKGDGTLGIAQTSSIASGLSSVAAADFNGDGRLDLALSSNLTRWTGTAYVTEGWVNLLLNNGNDLSGNVTFQAPRAFSSGTNILPGALAVGDLNGDSKVDVVAAQTNGANVTVLLGNGDGSLQTSRHYAVGSSPGSVAVGDFNDDGKLDLVAANRGSNNLSVLLNTGTAGNLSFAPASNSGVTGAVQSVTVGDLNDDGTLDLIATSNIATLHTFPYYGYYGGIYYGTYYTYEGYVNVLLGIETGAGAATGTFGAPAATLVTTNELGDLTVGDINRDGNLDVITADGIVRPYIDPTVLLGWGDGTFDAPYYYSSGWGPNTVMVADFNGDLAPDVATANTYSATVSVLLNDDNWAPLGAPTVAISGAPSVVEKNEGTTTLSFTISLSAPFGETVTVHYSTTDGTAQAGSDYVANNGTATFTAGQTSQTIEVLVKGDRVVESDEHFLVTLSNPSNARLGNAQAVGYIQDDEPRISISDRTIVEGNDGTTMALFTVSLSGEYDQEVSVNFSTVEGDTEGGWGYYGYYGYYYYPPPPPATAGTDFEAQVNQKVTFPVGETSQTIMVAVKGDLVAEDTEYFSIDLTDASANATISDGHGVGAIVDDEPRFTISQAYGTEWENLAYKYEGNTGTTTFTFAVTMSNAYDVPVSVSYSTADGSALAGSDYLAKSGTLTFKPGESLTQYVQVVVNGDRSAESDESFYVSLANPTAGIVQGAQTYGYILNDEPVISIGDVYQYEGNSGTTVFSFAVWMSVAYDQDVTVAFQTVNGTATAGTDYQAKSGTLTFKAGTSGVQYINIVVYGETTREANETFSVKLSGNPSYASLYDASGLGYIYNDDNSPGKGKKR